MGRWAWAIVCVAAVSLPFLAVDFVPVTDLPQHLGQVRLLAEAWSGDAAGLAVQWWTPYGLVYALLALPWAVLPPVVAGKIGVWLLVVLQVAGVHLVAARHRRPAAAAVLASAFVFNSQFYWGFLNFQWGAVVFLGWLALTARPTAAATPAWRIAASQAAVGILLYMSHALWFAFALLWMAVDAWLRRPSRRELLWRAVGMAPVVAAAGAWCLFLRGSAFATPSLFVVGPLGRLRPDVFSAAGLGGLRHPIDGLVVLVAVVWIVAAGSAGWRAGAAGAASAAGADRRLASLALLLLAAYLTLPDRFSNTMHFSARWLPYALMLGLLAVGELPLRRLLRRAGAVVLLVTLAVVNLAAWRGFERHELAGLARSLAALPPTPRVIGLSYLGESPRILGLPFLQVTSWAYAVHGGELNFSFAYSPLSLVVYTEPARVRWTWGLEWLPRTVRPGDFAHFDFALVGGDDEAHGRMERLPELEPVVEEGVWRLYRVVSAAPRAPAAAALD